VSVSRKHWARPSCTFPQPTWAGAGATHQSPTGHGFFQVSLLVLGTAKWFTLQQGPPTYLNAGFIPTTATDDESTGFYTGPCRSVSTLGSAPFRGCPGRLFNGLVLPFGSQGLFILEIMPFSVIKPMISHDGSFCTNVLSRRTLHAEFGIRQAYPPLRVGQDGGTVLHQVGLLDTTCLARKLVPVWRSFGPLRWMITHPPCPRLCGLVT